MERGGEHDYLIFEFKKTRHTQDKQEIKMYKNLEKIITIKSNKNGPIVVLMAGVHGNESCGVEILSALKDKLKLKKGKVFIIFGNPKAIKENKRQIQENLNRIFLPAKDLTTKEKQSYEFKRAKEIAVFLREADILLDLHASNAKKSKPFIICESNSLKLAKILPLSTVCIGFDSVHPGSTDYFMNKNKKIGICVECGSIGDKKANKIAQRSIESLLIHLKMIDSKKNIKENIQLVLRISSIYKTKTNNFKLQKNFKNFEKIKKGQCIATDGEEKIFSSSDQYILFAKNCFKVGEEGFVCVNNL